MVGFYEGAVEGGHCLGKGMDGEVGEVGERRW